MGRLSSWPLAAALLGALYLLSFPYQPGLRSPNELARMWQTRALVDDGSWVMNRTLERFGRVGDLSCTLVVRKASGATTLESCLQQPEGQVLEGRLYSSKAPLVSVLGAPVYRALQAVHAPVSELAQALFSRLFITVLPTLALLWLLRSFLRRLLEAPTADLLTFTYGLGSMAFSYAELYMSHQLTAVLLFACFDAAYRTQQGEWGRRGWALAGLWAGLTVTCEYTGALGVLCVATYVVAARWGRWVALGEAVGLVLLGGAAPLALLLWYHQSLFGHPLASGYQYLADAAYQGWHVGGFLGIKLPDPQAFVLSLFSPLRGFFALSPFLLLAFVGLGPLRRLSTPLWVMTVAFLLGHAYFTSSFSYQSWGWTVGPRHLTPVVPFLVLPAGLGLQWLAARGPLWAGAAVGLCLSSVLATSLVTFVNYVPDDVSTSLFALALPLLQAGMLPVSWLAALVPNPAPGALLLLLLLAAVGWVWAWGARRGAASLAVLVAAALHLGALRLATRYDDHDTAAFTLLRNVWVAPQGTRLTFF